MVVRQVVGVHEERQALRPILQPVFCRIETRVNAHGMKRFRPGIDGYRIPSNVTLIGIEQADIGSVLRHITDARLCPQARNRTQVGDGFVVVGLVQHGPHEEPVPPQVVFAFRIDSLKSGGGPEVIVQSRTGAAVLKNELGLPAVKIVDARLHPIVLITYLQVQGPHLLRNQFGVPRQTGVSQPCFIQAGSAERTAVQRLHREVRGRIPQDAPSRNNIQIEAADLIRLHAANQLQVVGEPVLVLHVESASPPFPVFDHEGRLDARVHLRALDVVDRGSERQPVPLREGHEVGPLEIRFIRVSVSVGILRCVQHEPGVGEIEAHLPFGGRPQRVPQVAKSPLGSHVPYDSPDE